MIEVKGTIVGNLSTIQSSEVNTKETVVGSLGSTKQSVNGFTNVGNTYVADYKLPIATEETLGGVIVGENLTVEEDGKLNAIVPTKVSELENDTGFINEIPEEYITDVELASKGYLTKVPEEYKTKEENDKLYQPIGDYALDTDIPEVPTKLSEFENDVGFINEIPSEYITESELAGSLSSKADKTEIPTKVSELENDRGFISEVPSEYITETELNAKGYLTEHQDISHLATKDELHTHSNKEILDSISQENIDKWNAGGNKPCNVIVDAVEPTNGEPIWVKQGRNLCNTKSMSPGYKLDSSGNVLNDLSYWGITDYIEVEPNTIYTMSGITYGSTSRYHVWYDENKNVISSIARFLDTVPSKTYTSPSNAKYIRFTLCIRETDDERTTFQFEIGKVATSYVPFIDEDNIFVRNTKGAYEQLYEMFPVPTTGGITEETDPTVPAHVKAITQADINNWNSGTGGGGGSSYSYEPNYITCKASSNVENTATGGAYTTATIIPLTEESKRGDLFTLSNNKIYFNRDCVASVSGQIYVTSKVTTGDLLRLFIMKNETEYALHSLFRIQGTYETIISPTKTLSFSAGDFIELRFNNANRTGTVCNNAYTFISITEV